MEAISETSLISFDNLPMTQELSQQLINKMDALMQGTWLDSYNCITGLRSINKFYPDNGIQVINRYLSPMGDLINNGKTQVVKNIFALARQVFSRGKLLNVEKCVFAFTGTLIKKLTTEHGHLKQMAKEALDQFVGNCGYDISFVIVAEYSCDKNVGISEASIKLMARLLQNLGVHISQLKPQTLQKVMKSLMFLIEGSRPNVKNWGLEICMFIFNLIGSANYLTLINYVLSQEEVKKMCDAMNNKKACKSKDVIRLATVLKQRKSMAHQAKMHNQNMSFNGQQFQNQNCGGQNYGNQW